MKVFFLGTGTSQGVPVVGCKCDICLSKDKKDKRLRSSVLINYKRKNIVIDTGPDFRQQMLSNDVTKLDAILYTHEHKDHLGGLDDIRPLNFLNKCSIPVYCSDNVKKALKQVYPYVFRKNQYPGLPQIDVNLINNNTFHAADIKVTPVLGLHHKLPIYGFRISNFTYLTDFSFISDIEKEKIRGSEILVVNGLRIEKHFSHFNLEEALDLISDIKPKKAYITHISHLMGKHKTISGSLPKNVQLAFDGLSIEV